MKQNLGYLISLTIIVVETVLGPAAIAFMWMHSLYCPMCGDKKAKIWWWFIPCLWASSSLGWLATGITVSRTHFQTWPQWGYLPSNLTGWWVLPCLGITAFISFMIWYAETHQDDDIREG